MTSKSRPSVVVVVTIGKSTNGIAAPVLPLRSEQMHAESNKHPQQYSTAHAGTLADARGCCFARLLLFASSLKASKLLVQAVECLRENDAAQYRLVPRSPRASPIARAGRFTRKAPPTAASRRLHSKSPRARRYTDRPNQTRPVQPGPDQTSLLAPRITAQCSAARSTPAVQLSAWTYQRARAQQIICDARFPTASVHRD